MLYHWYSFFNHNREFIKIYLDDEIVENPRFFIDFLKQEKIPENIKITTQILKIFSECLLNVKL